MISYNFFRYFLINSLETVIKSPSVVTEDTHQSIDDSPCAQVVIYITTNNSSGADTDQCKSCDFTRLSISLKIRMYAKENVEKSMILTNNASTLDIFQWAKSPIVLLIRHSKYIAMLSKINFLIPFSLDN